MFMVLAHNIFYCLFFFSTIVSLFDTLLSTDNKGVQTSSGEDANKEGKPKYKTVIKSIQVIASIALVLVAFAYVMKHYQRMGVVLLVFSIPFFLNRLVGTIISIEIVGKVIHSSESNKLSLNERVAIVTLAYAMFFIDMYKIPSKALDYFSQLSNAAVSDLTYIGTYITILFIYVFCSCAMLPIPLSILSNLYAKVSAFLRKREYMTKLTDYFISHIDKTEVITNFSLEMIDFYLQDNLIIRFGLVISLPILIVLDVLLVFLGMIRSFSMDTLGYCCWLIRQISRLVSRIMAWVNKLSDRRLVAISFRLALIATLTMTVITNRYTPLLREYESSTSVLEFLASTILIPVFFEWIGSAKAEH